MSEKWELTREELADFVSSLKEEKEAFRTPLEDLMKSDVILAERVNGEIAGICGTIKGRVFPRLYLVVRGEHQGKGVGKKLHLRLKECVEENYFIVKVIVRKNNKRALSLYGDVDYRIVKEDDEFYYMIRMTRYKFFQPIVVLLFRLICRFSFFVKYRLRIFGGNK
ncbi:GCN5-related N-acetyltransferase [Ferroglobus placidus DSM 10642]|uniref:GCN5-related N-acetyltransferase n=1 Tax=Ferroglobus placidus (strain DSM 10642 / AEDII12DO) TaxID=589924 RepID=D3RZY9_FERPA|nr:GNAT family N-acetyltransferase [Ferroglobus placidus]ADC66052.1 GCN5-related N-acetyltransferase [Ferroglobus placidus DSM 10642]